MDVDGAIHAWKIAQPAWKAVAGAEFSSWVQEALTDKARILLVHTRAYTKGSPHLNENNHPLFSDPLEGVIIHNGMVRNDDGLFEENKKLHGFKRSCNTDSDIFRALVDNNGGIDKELIKKMGLVDGTAAVAAIHRKTPGKLLLLRDSNPLILGATSDTIAFASTKEALHKVLKPWVKMHNIPMQVHAPDLSFIAMPNETGYIIDTKNGLEAHDVFKCNGKGIGGYVKYTKSTGYWDKQARAKADAILERQAVTPLNPTANGRVSTTPPAVSLDNPELYEFTICPNSSCNSHVELSPNDRKLSTIALLACRACGTNLAGGPDAGMSVH